MVLLKQVSGKEILIRINLVAAINKILPERGEGDDFEDFFMLHMAGGTAWSITRESFLKVAHRFDGGKEYGKQD